MTTAVAAKGGTLVAPSVLSQLDPMLEAKEFVVHKDLICHYSPFFAGAFNSSFSEGQTQTMTFDDVHSVPFGVLVNWIYTQTIANEEGKKPHIQCLGMVWILADRFLMPKLQNAVMDILVEELVAGRQTFLQGFARTACDYSNGDNMLAKVLVQTFVKRSITKATCELVLPSLSEALKTSIILKMKDFIIENHWPSHNTISITAKDFYVKIN